MNKAVYEKNMATLEKKYPVWAEILRTYKRKKNKFDVIIEKSYFDEQIMKVNDHGTIYYLNGKYDPSAVADEWLAQQGEIDKFASIIIIGISNGVHIKKIMDSVPKTVNILIYEPSYEIFRRSMEEFDLSFIFQMNIPVGIIVDHINTFEQDAYFHKMIAYDNLISFKLYISGNYKQLFPEKVGDFVKDLKYYCSQISITWNTLVRYTDINASNIFHNLPYLYEGYSISDLKGILPEDVPVIVVSAGPSLDKNILDLKAAIGKSCIIATDTAIKPLLNAGIIPDLFVIVDGLKPIELFEHKDLSKIAMVTMTIVSTGPMDLHKGKKFFSEGRSPYEIEMVHLMDAMDDRKIILPGIPTGGSVANSAYSLGVYMGAKTIILIGQDLALTGNRVHADGTFENESCEIDLSSSQYVEVESVDGEMVVTRLDLKNYLEWFEKTIKDWNIRTIDATEGGALIHGTKLMTLKKAIKKYCVSSYNTKHSLANIPRIANTSQQQEKGLQFLENSEKRLETVKMKAEEGLKYYDKLLKLVNNNSMKKKEFQSTYKKIKKINNFMENDTMAETVTDSLKGIEYTLRPSIYHIKENEQDEIKDIIEQGRIMLSAIRIGAEEIKSIVRETVIPYIENQRKQKTKLIEQSNEKDKEKL